MDKKTGGREIEARLRNAGVTALAVWLATLLLTGCGPALITRTDFNRNPLEIVEESPRVYHVVFEHFADSLETLRVVNYMNGTIPYGFYIPADTGRPAASRRDSALTEYGKAVKRHNAGAYQAGLMHVRRAIELDPAFLPAYVMLARFLIADGQVLRARDVLTQVLSRNSTYSEALVELARCHMYMGQFDAAKQALVDAVIYERTNLDAWGQLKRLGALGEFEVAARDAPELAFVEQVRGRHLDMIIDSSLVDCPMEASAWVVFASQRAVWKYEGKYRQRYGNSGYQQTYDEDVDCYMSLAVAYKMLSGRPDSTLNAEQAGCDSEYLEFLAEVSDAGHLVSHVLMDYICLNNPGAARRLSPAVIQRMRDYVNEFVLIAGTHN